MSGCAIALPAGCWLAPVLASRWRGGLEIRFPPQLRWGGVREADGGVMGVEEDDDPSGPYGPPPQLRWGGNPLPNENGAPQGPVSLTPIKRIRRACSAAPPCNTACRSRTWC